MRKIYLAALSPLFCGLVSPSALASGLDELNAYVCGAEPVPTQYHSSGTRLRPPSEVPRFHDLYGMSKLKMVYDHGDFTETEHCGAMALNSRWLVTAAHCLDSSYDSFVDLKKPPEKRWNRIDIFAGQDVIDDPNVLKRTALSAVCHAGYSYSYLANDIALIRLNEPLPEDPEWDWFPLDEYRRPSVVKKGLATLLGWPITGVDAGHPTLTVTYHQVEKVEWPGYITAIAMGLEGPCRGESGGPMFGIADGIWHVAGVLAGIEKNTEDASGEPCMKEGYELYYTPIAAYREWIDTVIGHCDENPWDCGFE